MSDSKSLLVELFTEELPPKALPALMRAFADGISADLRAHHVLEDGARITPCATPRRLAVHITGVLAQAPDAMVHAKLMPVRVGLDAAGQPTAPLIKKLAALGVDAAAVLGQLRRAQDGKNETLFYDHRAQGATLAAALQHALDGTLHKLPIPKVMTYQLQRGTALPGWDSVQFVRPAHGLVALHGADVVPVRALGLEAGRSTHGHRFEAAQDPITIATADAYADTLREAGAVIVSFKERRAQIAAQLDALAAPLHAHWRPQPGTTLLTGVGALLDEVTALVERPNALLCAFEEKYLAVPPECLILTMQANQKYFPLLDAAGRLSNRFIVVSNIAPEDASAIVSGNERVVRPRLADAEFFFNQDRKTTLASRVPGLAGVVYHNELGTQGERTERVRAIARAIGAQLGGAELARQADQAAQLAKTDLLTGMVGEFPELQGTMGRYYALHDGLAADIADAIEDHYKPRFAGDTLPRGQVGTAVALADKLETLVGMFGIGNLPTGEKDPFALRRHALGVIRILIEGGLDLRLDAMLGAAAEAFASLSTPARDFAAALAPVRDFIHDRLRGYVAHDLPAAFTPAGGDTGYSAQEIDAVISLRPERLLEVPRRLQAVRGFAARPEAPALAAANKRIGNILKKSDTGDAAPRVDTALLRESAEQALHAALRETLPQADRQFESGDYAASLQTLAALRAPVDAFFDGVMVNADDPALKANRLALLARLHAAMNRVADLSCLAA